MAASTLNISPEQLLKLNNAFEKGEHSSTDEMDENTPKQKAKERPTLDVRSTQKVSRRDKVTKNACSEEAIHTYTDVKKEAMRETFQGLKANKSVNSKRIPFSKNERVKAALDWLCTTFPSLFSTSDRLPLKLGIMHDIIGWIAVQNKGGNVLIDIDTGEYIPAIFPTKTAIRDALSFYTHSQQYQKSLLEKDKRYDLNGSEVGVVDVYQKDYANQRKATREAAIHARKIKHDALKERRKQHASSVSLIT